VLASGESFKTKGYPEIAGPSALCTGAAGSRFGSFGWRNLCLMALVLVVVQLAMQYAGDSEFEFDLGSTVEVE